MFREGGFYNAVDYVDHHQDMRLDIEDMSYEVRACEEFIYLFFLSY